jgi:lysophospholipase L1-like esterase
VRVTRLRVLFVAGLLALLAPASVAAAREIDEHTIEIGRVSTGTTAAGGVSLLVPVRYGIQLAGRSVETRVWLFNRGSGVKRKWVLHDRLSSGHRRTPERRRSFVFVHRIDLGAALADQLRGRTKVRVLSPNWIDVEGDGSYEVGGISEAVKLLAPPSRRLCSSIPRLRVRPGRTISVPLPACGKRLDWNFTELAHGRARIRGNRLIYQAPRRFRGSVEIELVEAVPDRNVATASAMPVSSVAEVTVGTADPGVVVRALGDSVTAGFGYFSNGTAMTLKQLLGCRPPAKGYDDACSSNSLVTSNKAAKVEYAPDYGLANNIAWAAQWANEHGVTNFANYAISGSEPANWAPGGEFHETTKRIESQDPDYILMTMGANPLLSEMLFGVDNMDCAVYADVFGGYRECIEEAFAEVKLQASLKALYADLVKNTDATIFLMQYHLSVPSVALAYSATQIAEMGKLLNREIAAVAAEVNPQRLRVVAPPHFDVGIDISPVYPASFSCSRLGFKVDGPSVQSDPTQDELAVLHPFSFCEGPAGGGPPWVISGDTGIHPSGAGYAQMASQVPPPE